MSNTIIFTGNLTKDSELRHTQQGKAVLGFDLANNQGYGENQHTEYYPCSMWGDRATKLAEHFTKGTKLLIIGEHRTEEREHNGKTYKNNKVFVKDFEFMGGKQENQGGQQQAPQQGGDFSDDIPFLYHEKGMII